VQRSVSLGANRPRFPRASQKLEDLDGELRGHARSVVGDPNLVDAAQFVPTERDSYFGSIRIEGVPDQLDHAHQGIPDQSLKMVLFDVNVMPGQRASLCSKYAR
jgi:hypothetical protein